MASRFAMRVALLAAIAVSSFAASAAASPATPPAAAPRTPGPCSAASQSSQPEETLITLRPVSSAATPPNIVSLVLDDASYGDATMAPTPHMDNFAASGAILSYYFVASPACTPSRYSMLTGRLASRNLALRAEQSRSEPVDVGWNTHLNASHSGARSELTLFDRLKHVGYRTAYIGKYHLAPVSVKEELAAYPLDALAAKYARSIEEVRNATGADVVGRVYMWNLNSVSSEQAPLLPAPFQFHNPEWVVEGAIDFIAAPEPDPHP